MLSVICYMKMAIIPGQASQNIIIDTPQKQKSRKLLVFLAGIVVLTGLIIYFGYGNGPSSSPSPTNAVTSTEQQINESSKNLEALNDISLNNPVFTDKKFQSLTASDRLPVVAGTKGRTNPFAPF